MVTEKIFSEGYRLLRQWHRIPFAPDVVQSLYAIAANLIYHCVLASKSRQTKPRCSSSDKKKREVNRWCFFLFPTACLVDLNCIFFTFCALSTRVTLCSSLRVSTASTSFFLPGFVRHTYTHTHYANAVGESSCVVFLFVVLLRAGFSAYCLRGLSADWSIVWSRWYPEMFIH